MIRGVSFEVDGKSLTLRFDYAAMAVIEGKIKAPFSEIGNLLKPKDGSAPFVKDLIMLFWAGLGAKGTEDEAAEIMSDIDDGINPIELLMQAIVAAFPTAETAISDDAQAAESGNVMGAAA